MADTLKLEIVTPIGTAYSKDVDMVILSGVEGRMGILLERTLGLRHGVKGVVAVR